MSDPIQPIRIKALASYRVALERLADRNGNETIAGLIEASLQMMARRHRTNMPPRMPPHGGRRPGAGRPTMKKPDPNPRTEP